MSELQQLITISKNVISGEEIQTVDARELHLKLEVKTEFRHWIKRRIEDAKLIDGQDFIVTVKNDRCSTQGGQPSKEYMVSIDAAKHIAMMEGNEQGTKIRQYFIEFEKAARLMLKKYNDNPLIAHAEQILEMTQKYVKVQEEQQKLTKMFIEQ